MASRRSSNAVRNIEKYLQIELNAGVNTSPLSVSEKLKERLFKWFVPRHDKALVVEAAYVAVHLQGFEPAADLSGFISTMSAIRSTLAAVGIEDVREIVCSYRQSKQVSMRITIKWLEVEPKKIRLGGFYG